MFVKKMVNILELVISKDVFKLGCLVISIVGIVINVKLVMMWIVWGGKLNWLIY